MRRWVACAWMLAAVLVGYLWLAEEARTEIVGISFTQADGARLTWPPDAQRAASIEIRRNRNGGPWAVLVTLPATATSWDDPGPLAAGATYCWRVVAVNPAGQDHVEACADVPVLAPVAPSDLTVVLTGAGVADFIVSPDGSDSGEGSFSDPWRTIQHAADTAVPGSVIAIRAGTYPEHVSVQTQGLAFIAGEGVRSRGFALLAGGSTVAGFDVEPSGCGARTGVGIWVGSAGNIVTSNFVHDSCRSGIHLGTSLPEDPIGTSRTDDPRVSGNHVRGNTVVRAGVTGITVEGRGNVIEGNEVSDTLGIHPKWAGSAPNWVGDANGFEGHGSGHWFIGNHVHSIVFKLPTNPRPHIDCFQTFQAGGGFGLRDSVFEQNRCDLPVYQRPGESGTAFMLAQAEGIVIRRNWLRAFSFVNTGGGGVSRVQFQHNVLVGDSALNDFEGGTALSIGAEADSAAQNNLAIDIHIRWMKPGHGWLVGHNAVWRSDGSMPVGTPGPGTLWGIDPLVDSSQRPLADSPLIDAGIPVGLPFEGAAPDIGAHEAG